jgi:hypothetical protein
MNCPKCGKPVEAGAAFCGNCGQPLQASIQQPQTTAPVVTVSNHGEAGPVAPAQYPQADTSGDEHSSEVRGIIGLILGVIGIPTSIVPIMGIVFAVAGLILGTTSRSKFKHKVSLFAIVFSSIGILTALGVFTYNVIHDPALHHNSATSSSSSSSNNSNLVAINTLCYSVKIDRGMNNYQPDGCSFESASTSEEFNVTAVSNSNITASNFITTAKEVEASGVSSQQGHVISEKQGTFDGSIALIAQSVVNSNGEHENLMTAEVLHPSSGGDNIFIISKGLISGTPSFGSLESTWQWK